MSRTRDKPQNADNGKAIGAWFAPLRNTHSARRLAALLGGGFTSADATCCHLDDTAIGINSHHGDDTAIGEEYVVERTIGVAARATADYEASLMKRSPPFHALGWR
jgi:hypothetical protein